MPRKGWKQSESHKNKLSFIAKQRPNGWLGRRHTEQSLEKMQRTKSESHIRNMSRAAIKRWSRNKPEWYIRPEPKVKPEPMAPMEYHDIFERDGSGTVWLPTDGSYEEGWD